ncbi:MAG: hypothetical protein HQK75_03780 [Candidatus Magnetomorum sp.]|nr:hypothetical protein [Candidatus Magnetomorum sp.]
MILEIIEKHKTIIQNFEIQKFKIVSKSYQLICNVLFINNSQLFIRDYLFLDGERKYSYHWQNELNECLVRWDNAPHHQEITTYPFHKHIGKDENIEDSEPMKLESVLKYIQNCVE